MEKKRVQFTLPAALVDKLDRFCAEKSISRSAYLETMLAITLDSYKELMQLVSVAALREVTGENEQS